MNKKPNKVQSQAIKSTTHPTIITGIAGTGKTTVLGYKLAYLTECNLASENILIFTPKKKVAQEIKTIAENKLK